MEIKEISVKKVVALVFSSKLKSNGVKFLTPENYPLQVGLIEHPSGKIIKNHIHRQDIKYNVDSTQEFLHIMRGKIKVKLFTDLWEPIEEVILTAGDSILFIGGGHGIEVLEKCKIIEVKQGPYPGDKLAKIIQDE